MATVFSILRTPARGFAPHMRFPTSPRPSTVEPSAVSPTLTAVYSQSEESRRSLNRSSVLSPSQNVKHPYRYYWKRCRPSFTTACYSTPGHQGPSPTQGGLCVERRDGAREEGGGRVYIPPQHNFLPRIYHGESLQNTFSNRHSKSICSRRIDPLLAWLLLSSLASPADEARWG